MQGNCEWFAQLPTESREFCSALNMLFAVWLSMEIGGLLKFSCLVGRWVAMSPESVPGFESTGMMGEDIVHFSFLMCVFHNNERMSKAEGFLFA